ncbi:MAG: AraC family transcriptional regulator [Bacteroidota bacterium]
MPKFSFSIADLIGLIIIYQSFFFTLNLYLQNKKQTSFNRILSAFTALFALNFLNILLINQGILNQNHNFGLVYGLLYGPVFYFYTLFLTDKGKKFQQKDSLHFLPAAFILILILLAGSLIQSENSLFLLTILVLGHIFYYLSKAFMLIRSLQQLLKDNFSEIESRRLAWLRSLILSVSFIILFAGLEAFIPLTYASLYGDIYFMLISLFSLMIINFMFYKGLQYPEILKEQLIPPPKEKYKGSKLDPNQAREILRKLDACMEDEKPYLNEELSIRELAEILGVSSKNLSRVINEQKGMNFFDYINHFRIEEACDLLKSRSSSELRINEIMYQVGFRSKSTFNQVFKQKMGMTPNAYRSAHRKKS